MELLTFTIAANETKEFRKAGRYLEIIDSSYACTLRLIGSDGNQTDDATNALSGIFIEETYSALQVYSALAQSITLLIHDGRGGSRRQPGVVSIVDGGKARTVANQAFIGYWSAAAGASQVPQVQLFNPAGSGVRVIVKAIRLSSATANYVALYRYDVALPTGPNDPINKRMGGASSVAKMYSNIGAFPAPGSTVELVAIGGSAVVPIVMTEPIVLEPGRGLLAWHQAAASTLLAAFEFVEEPM